MRRLNIIRMMDYKSKKMGRDIGRGSWPAIVRLRYVLLCFWGERREGGADAVVLGFR
jgi:hypothetical protein